MASSTFATTSGGAKARIAAQNAAGGVDGRKLVLTTADDTSSAQGNLTAAEVLVQTDHAFAVVGDNADMIGSAKYLYTNNVPVAGLASVTYGTKPYTNEFGLQGQTGPVDVPTTLLGQAFKQAGVSKVAILNYTIDTFAQSSQVKGIQAAGLSVCYTNSSIQFGTTDFTSQVLAMKQAGCQGAYFPAVEASDVALAVAIQQAGANIKQILITGYDQNTLDDTATRTAAQGDLWEATFPVELNNAGDQAYLADLKKYDSQYKGGLPDFATDSGWVATDLLIQGLQMAGPNPTRAAVIKDLQGLTNYNAGGVLLPAISFNHFGQLQPGLQCLYFVQLKGSSFAAFPPTDQPICGSIVSSS